MSAMSQILLVLILSTGTERKVETTLIHQSDVKNKEHGSLSALEIVLIGLAVILSCLLVVVIINAAISCYERRHKKHTSNPPVPPVYFNNRRQDVTIGAASQGTDRCSGTLDNSSCTVHSVEVHDLTNQASNEYESSPLISALEEQPEEAASPGCSEVPDNPIREADLVKLAKTIGDGWEAAGIQVLDITSAQLRACKTNNPYNRDMQIFDMLNLWKCKAKGATLQTLCQLLTQAEVDYTVEE